MKIRLLGKYFLLLLAAIALVSNKMEAQNLVLHHPDKTITEVDISTKTRLTFRDNKVLVSSSMLNLEFDKNDILGYTFESNPTGIKAVKDDVEIVNDYGRMFFRNLRPQDKVIVYTIKGECVQTQIERNDNEIMLPLSALPSGTYIVKVKEKSVKISLP